MLNQVKNNKYKGSTGFTIIEIIVVVLVIMILFVALMLVFNPIKILQKGRDDKRIGDVALLDRIISEYRVDKGSYPDTANTLRQSNVLPAGSTALSKSNMGWIHQNLLSYNVNLPLDPLNTAPYVYKYIHNNDKYEINATLEVDFDPAIKDGGTSNTVYELGNDLTLISP